VYNVMDLPSLGALSLTPTGAGTARRQAGQICTTIGSKGWGICIGPQNAEQDTSKAIPVSNNQNENTPSVVPCIGGVYKLLRAPGLSNGIIYESDYMGNGHMCCVISDNTQYMGLNRLHSTIETVLNIRKVLAKYPGPTGVSAAKALRNGMDEEIFYSDPILGPGAVPKITAYATSVRTAFDNMLRQKQAHERERALRRSNQGMPHELNNRIFDSSTAHSSWKNCNLFVRLTSAQLNRIYRHDGVDKEMRANNNAVFAQHYLYLGTWKLARRESGGSVFTQTVLDNNPMHETMAMHELSNHLSGAGSQAESLFVHAFQQFSSPQFAGEGSSQE